MSAETDNTILARMLADAETLCQCSDALLEGQYRHLRDRVRALIELRACYAPAEPEKP
jgi:hypothetical protein